MNNSTKALIALLIAGLTGATIFVTEPNAPCRQPGRKIAEAYGNPVLESAFPKHAMGLRGVVGLVEREGPVAVGDPVKVIELKYRGERTVQARRAPAGAR